MNINHVLQLIDNFFISINSNISILICILLLLAVYAIFFNKIVTEKYADVYTNDIFKIILFGIITYILSHSIVIGVSLTIMLLLSLQILTNYRIKQIITNEQI